MPDSSNSSSSSSAVPWLLLVGLIWGASNPFMKLGGRLREARRREREREMVVQREGDDSRMREGELRGAGAKVAGSSDNLPEVDARLRNGMAPVGKEFLGLRLWKKVQNDVVCLIQDWQYFAPLLVNLSGSLIFFITLSSAPVSLAAPVANGTTFIVTAIVGSLLGERLRPVPTLLGIVFVILGIALTSM